ncbi:UNVERIFIED_CONTAM: hypothetical protein FKN15_074514 [Acipenser sinensis]
MHLKKNKVLEIEKGRTTELSDGLAREQQRLAQEYKQRLEEEALRREGVATQEHNFIQQLQAQLDQERERTVELAAMMEKTQQQAIQAKRQLEAGVQQSREEAQREHDTAAKLHTVLETLQTQKQELERSLETERQQGTRLRADIEQLQGKIQSVKQKERSREEQREVQRRQDRQALSEKDRRHERDSEKLHEMELQHQRDQLRIKQLQQTLSELEEQERDLSSRKQQQTGVLGTGHSCSFPQAPDRKSFFLHQQHLQFTRQQLQLATLRLKDLVHSSSASRTFSAGSVRPENNVPALKMGGSGSKSRGFWPFAGSGIGSDPANGGNEQTLSRLRGSRSCTPFVFTRRSSLYYDEDGDLAHEFYEETIVTKNGRKRAKLKKIQKNLIPQGMVKLDHPRIHVDFPVVLCEV